MHIELLSIRNFRNFGNTTFKVALKPFTLIIGANNIGKTNLLNAIGLIFSQEITIFKKRSLSIDDFNYETIKSFKKQVVDTSILDLSKIDIPIIKIEANLTDFTTEQAAVVGDWCIDKKLTKAKVTYQFAPVPSFDKDKWILEQRANLTKDWNDIDFPIEHYQYSIYGGGDSANRCDSYFLRMIKMELLDALRDAKKELSANNESRLLYKVLNRKKSTNYAKLKSILQDLEKEIKDNNNSIKDIKTEVNALLDKVSLTEDGILNKIDFEFSSPEKTEVLKKLSIVYGDNPISIDRNGLGRNNLLYISLLLSQIIEEEKNNGTELLKGFTTFRLIGIEEPEAHLHPNLQNHLADNIEEISTGQKHLQLLLTSHSTHITSKLSLNNSLILYSEKNKHYSHYILDGLDASNKDDRESIGYLTKYLDATKSTMFYSKKIILVEGIAEQLLMPKFFELVTGKKLEKENCTIVNVNGIAFKHFLKLIKNGFFVKCVVFTDSDASKNTKNRAPDLKKDYDSNKITIEITSKNTFELDLIDTNKIVKITDTNKENILLDVLENIKKKKRTGHEIINYRTELKGDLNCDDFFEEIKNYKSEFSFKLLEELNKSSTSFKVPNYIAKGLKFLLE